MRGTKARIKGDKGGGRHAELTDVTTGIHYTEEQVGEQGKEGGGRGSHC